MRIHSFQHVDFEGLGSIEDDLIARAFTLTTTHWYRGDHAPSVHSFDALIVMGGPMSIYDEAIYPWLAEEKRVIKAAITEGKIVIGICLGAQLIADALGARVTRNLHKEIGWLPLKIQASASDHPIARILGNYADVFHWHGDTFAIPAGATHIASSEACANQAFVYHDKVYGFQFHLETTPASAAALIENCGEDIDGSLYTQSAQTILESGKRFTAINEAMSEIIAHIFEQPGDGKR